MESPDRGSGCLAGLHVGGGRRRFLSDHVLQPGREESDHGGSEAPQSVNLKLEDGILFHLSSHVCFTHGVLYMNVRLMQNQYKADTNLSMWAPGWFGCSELQRHGEECNLCYLSLETRLFVQHTTPSGASHYLVDWIDRQLKFNTWLSDSHWMTCRIQCCYLHSDESQSNSAKIWTSKMFFCIGHLKELALFQNKETKLNYTVQTLYYTMNWFWSQSCLAACLFPELKVKDLWCCHKRTFHSHLWNTHKTFKNRYQLMVVWRVWSSSFPKDLKQDWKLVGQLISYR